MTYKLHEDTLALVKEERRLTGLVIENLQKISAEQLHLEMGYSSLFEYCTKALGYSEHCAYRRLQAVKVAQLLPEVKEKLNSGSLNLTNLSMAQSLITSATLSTSEKREVIKGIHRLRARTQARSDFYQFNQSFIDTLDAVQTDRIHALDNTQCATTSLRIYDTDNLSNISLYDVGVESNLVVCPH